MSSRIHKINSLIKSHINDILSKDVHLKPGLFVTVSKVDTTADLRYTRIFLSVFPEKEFDYVMRTLKKEIYAIQGKLNKKLSLKIFPKIEFKVDRTPSMADKLERLLQEKE